MTRKRLFTLLAILVLLAGFVSAVWYLDKMALAFLTGQRRVAGKDWFGQEVRMEGPPPGYLFLGFSRPSEDPKGIRDHSARGFGDSGRSEER